ncbi:type II toxin-antitoxin system PemK/MazF family toxin [Brevundimonas balnearis]|uniref:Type II toxin-antitoxin system PemK/MazF family toxin n=1 Tax=Brevundimonas balnearis TaxID=1572858 RepID=A0ABV6R282_9CAUL
MKRGDIVITLVKGEYGKPRPALVVQNDRFSAHTSMTIALISGTLAELDGIRLTIEPSPSNGLRKPSQVQLDRLQTVPRGRIKDVVGRLSAEEMTRVDRGIALFLGLA